MKHLEEKYEKDIAYYKEKVRVLQITGAPTPTSSSKDDRSKEVDRNKDFSKDASGRSGGADRKASDQVPHKSSSTESPTAPRKVETPNSHSNLPDQEGRVLEIM